MSENGRWVLTVKLDTGTIAGAEVVQVAFDEPQLACTDGADLSPSAVPVGVRVHFVRVGEDADMMAPPGIGGRRVQVECHADPASRAVPTWDSPGPGGASDGALAVGELYGEVVGVGGGFVHAYLGCGDPSGEVFFAASATEVNGTPAHITRW